MSVAMKPSEALRKAREKITPEGAWTQNTFARNETGRAVNPSDDDAVCWCGWGAIVAVNATTDETYCAATPYVERVIGSWIPHWQDAPGRTHAEVLDAFRKAEELALSEGR